MISGDPLILQYEDLPYPPIPWIALPARDQGRALRYPGTSRAGIRILIAGCGTFEPLVVGQNHPQAREIVAVDASSASLRVLRRRLGFARGLSRGTAGLLGRRTPPITIIHADLVEWARSPQGEFDYILASNVLHHLADPAEGLRALASRLAPGGTLRVVTYPRHSRLWVRATGAWLREQGLSPSTPDLVARARKAVASLPVGHPFRSAFESQRETRNCAGLVDAFLNARENPLSPLEWRDAAHSCGLELVGEGQTETSRSDFLAEILPETRALGPWERLQILDDLLELCANPVFWFRKSAAPEIALGRATHLEPATGVLKSALADAGVGLRRALALLTPCGVDAQKLRRALESQVGPRVTERGAPLPGLSLLDHDWRSWLDQSSLQS